MSQLREVDSLLAESISGWKVQHRKVKVLCTSFRCRSLYLIYNQWLKEQHAHGRSFKRIKPRLKLNNGWKSLLSSLNVEYSDVPGNMSMDMNKHIVIDLVGVYVMMFYMILTRFFLLSKKDTIHSLSKVSSTIIGMSRLTDFSLYVERRASLLFYNCVELEDDYAGRMINTTAINDAIVNLVDTRQLMLRKNGGILAWDVMMEEERDDLWREFERSWNNDLTRESDPE